MTPPETGRESQAGQYGAASSRLAVAPSLSDRISSARTAPVALLRAVLVFAASFRAATVVVPNSLVAKSLAALVPVSFVPAQPFRIAELRSRVTAA